MANILKDRDQRVIDAAIECAKESGYRHITREAVAARACVAPATVFNAFGTMLDLKGRVMRVAVERGLVELVAQGIADGSPIALGAPEELKRAALSYVISAA